ncbi:MAG: Uma2 family endonuclease [Planctomycetota bacterium]|nr:Uma2 family endonuclease [Planctomycetota bacterium]
MPALFSRIDWERLPEGFPAQLVDGQLIREPAPTYGHESVRMELLRRLMPLVGRGLLVAAPVDVLVDEHNVVQPDIAVLERIPPRDTSYVGTPLVVFEILSPSTADQDRDTKAPKYLALGVREVWLVDPLTRTLELRTRRGSTALSGAQVLASASIAGFRVTPNDLFS